MRDEFEARRDLVCRRLPKIKGITCAVPDGAFYAFFNVSALFGRTLGGTTISDSAAFCQAALEQAHVNLVAGSAFGAEGFVRLSYAASIDELNGGLDALDKWLG
jgi:aspartate aminotransferase